MNQSRLNFGADFFIFSFACEDFFTFIHKIGKPYEKATELDLKRLVNTYENGEYSFWTKHDVKVILKQYYAWLNKSVVHD
ncbi:hypothetical protein J4211_04990 [Candidatus Woesearchaeota archaeon]|nr:hypothetical protein [Candidatus Woesearchaeota archaeon]